MITPNAQRFRSSVTRVAVALAVLSGLLCGCLLLGCGESYEQKEARQEAARQQTAQAEDRARRESPTYTAYVICENCFAGRYRGSGAFPVTASKGQPVSSVPCPYCQVWRKPPAGGNPCVSTLASASGQDSLESLIADIVDDALDARGSSE